MKKIIYTLIAMFLMTSSIFAQNGYNQDPFKQLHELLPTPNVYRTASGAPGHKYWQQRVDYSIKVKLDAKSKKIEGTELITYHNNSPDVLEYLWVQLDQNVRKPDALSNRIKTVSSKRVGNKIPFALFNRITMTHYDGGYKITAVKDGQNQDLPYVINETMMRIDLPEPLKPGDKYNFNIDWNYLLNNIKNFGGRGGYEYFEEDGNNIYEIAQWYPRMCVYSDALGWQNKQFLGRGEFALEFGDYDVEITVPADHVVGATGELQNAEVVLEKKWLTRFEKSKTSKEPVFIITPKEAKENEKSRSSETKTWHFKAENVRDFAWASSRKFIWDAIGVKMKDRTVMAMSLYPNEAEALWSKFSTRAIEHTLKVYSKFTFDYPYPVAYSINGPVGGMEYPMVSFNGPRPEKDGTYSERTKGGLIAVIIHEVGHGYFPMIVNSDERQWTWMDEGINTFLEFIARQEWEEDFPVNMGYPNDIVKYMSSDKSSIVPIMSNSESILQLLNNAYGKPATALNILRETIMGRELFDYAFKKYAERWAFKHPEPADFFRTMEDASAVDLDWFWRGWFYSTDAVDISITNLKMLTVNSKNPEIEKPLKRALAVKQDPYTEKVNKENNMVRVVDTHTNLKDFYTKYDPYKVTKYDKEVYEKYISSLSDEQKTLLNQEKYLYFVEFENVGGLVMPVILHIQYEDNSTEIKKFPAEVWVRAKHNKVEKLLVTDKKIKELVLDPYQETADIDQYNNNFPRKIMESKFDLFKREKSKKQNLMQKSRDGKL